MLLCACQLACRSPGATVILDRPVRVVAYAEPTRPPATPIRAFRLRIGRGADCFEARTLIHDPGPTRGENAITVLRRSIGWKDGFLFVRQECGGGNMWRCNVEDVFELRRGRLVPLGALAARAPAGIGTCREHGRFLDVYDDLEINPVTSHAGAPAFQIVARAQDGRLVVDPAETWDLDLGGFRSRQALAEALKRPAPEDPRTDAEGRWEGVVSPRLANAALARYCDRAEELNATLREAEAVLPPPVLARFRKALEVVEPGRLPRATRTRGATHCPGRTPAPGDG
jgi:hypothetical protein